MSENDKKEPKRKEDIVQGGSEDDAQAEKTSLEEVEEALSKSIEEWSEFRDGIPCYTLILHGTQIGNDLVDDVYDDLRSDYKPGKLDVIVWSSGGHIDPAFNLALMFRRWGREHLDFIVPRWAKSAATMLVCGGDTIHMTPAAELGPLDPQITEMNPLEKRLEQFSPLHIDATMKLIRDEYESGNKDLADALIGRLQFPLTLGSYKSMMNIGKQYLKRLLTSRMLRGKDELAQSIAEKMVSGYSDHGYCIDVQEAAKLGLNAKELEGQGEDIAWRIHQLTRKKRMLERIKREQEVDERLKNLPDELLDLLPDINS
jgi:ClpP class serine protease